MSARVLVVDDLLPNIKLLEARLSAEYFDVTTAMSGPEAIAICAQGRCDIVLLDVMMPGMDGFEVCRRLKADPATAHIPVVMVTALDQPADRVRGLEAGADDFLTKPVDEIALIARVRSLSRLKVVIDELRNRAMTSAGLGMPNLFTQAMAETGLNGRIMLVDDRASSTERITTALAKLHKVDAEKDPNDALFRCAEGDYDLIVVSLGFQNYDALRLCGQIRSLERTRHLPILLIAEPEDRTRILRGLDLGVNDYLMRPLDRNELVARVRTQVRRKRYADGLRENVQASIEMAVVDPLTGLNNRRYVDSHIGGLVAQSARTGQALTLMILDIDHFKAVNDTYGHGAGDEVLKGFAARVKKVIRGADLLARLGGEEFIVVMPDTPPEAAQRVAERVRHVVEAQPFPIDGGARSIRVTVSIGVAERRDETAATPIIARADQALYRAKHDGRNRVFLDAA